MKINYDVDIIINLPREEMIRLFDDPDNLSKWQPTLQSFTHLDGIPGEPGARSKLIYNENGRIIEMIETVTTRNLPHEFSGTYEMKGVKNWVVNRFTEVEPGKTKWVAENIFEFSGFMNLVAIFMRRAFPKQTLDFMQKFKEFAEKS